MATAKLIFEVKRGVIRLEESSAHEEIIIHDAITLCKETKYEAAVNLILENMQFDWDWSACCNNAASLFEDPTCFSFQCCKHNTRLRVGLENDQLSITAATEFDIDIKHDFTLDEFQEFIYDNSCYSCGSFGFWFYHHTDGDSVYISEWNGTSVDY